MKVYVKRHAGAAQDMRLAAFAHDIRTPLCCVTGAAQTAMAAGRQGKDVSAQMEQILLAVSAMDRLLAQLCGDMERCQTFTEEKLRRELLAMIGGRAREKDQLLEIDLSALGRETFVCDYAALSRVLVNLLANAVKYTPPGGRVALCAELLRGERARFTVSDNGMGMKPEFLKRLFVPFERAAESAHLPGKGLGLSIAQRLAARMGGEIGVSSEWGRGTAFTLTIPLERKGKC